MGFICTFADVLQKASEKPKGLYLGKLSQHDLLCSTSCSDRKVLPGTVSKKICYAYTYREARPFSSQTDNAQFRFHAFLMYAGGSYLRKLARKKKIGLC